MYNVQLTTKNSYPKLEYNENLAHIISDKNISNNSFVYVYTRNKSVMFSQVKNTLLNSVNYKLYKSCLVKDIKTNNNGKNWFIEILVK